MQSCAGRAAGGGSTRARWLQSGPAHRQGHGGRGSRGRQQPQAPVGRAGQAAAAAGAHRRDRHQPHRARLGQVWRLLPVRPAAACPYAGAVRECAACFFAALWQHTSAEAYLRPSYPTWQHMSVEAFLRPSEQALLVWAPSEQAAHCTYRPSGYTMRQPMRRRINEVMASLEQLWQHTRMASIGTLQGWAPPVQATGSGPVQRDGQPGGLRAGHGHRQRAQGRRRRGARLCPGRRGRRSGRRCGRGRRCGLEPAAALRRVWRGRGGGGGCGCRGAAALAPALQRLCMHAHAGKQTNARAPCLPGSDRGLTRV